MRATPARRRAACVAGMALALAGCARSSPARFYQLEPVRGRNGVVAPDQAPQGRAVVAVGPLRVPDYLDRSQIVTRTGTNELKLAEFDRWAGSLEGDLARVLAENLAVQLPADRFFVVRWSPLIESQVPISYRVEVLIQRFDGVIGDSVALKAQWGLFSKARGLLFHAESTASEPVSGKTYPALVTAMSKTTAKLSQDIAARIVAMKPGSEVSGR